MPNRILREGILTSERVNKLTPPAEVFYRRLMSVVDDFGRFYAKHDLLRAGLFPLKLDTVRNADIASWIGCAREAGLLVVYSVEGKDYLELLDFRQQVRAKVSKFPAPTADAMQTCSTCVADAQHMRTKTYPYSKSIYAPSAGGFFGRFWAAYPRKKSRGDAEKAIAKLQPDEQLQDRILHAIERAKTSADWLRDGGKYIPYPASWVNAHGWDDEHAVAEGQRFPI